jgi:hypothetical protein
MNCASKITFRLPESYLGMIDLGMLEILMTLQ